jgi:hypothetical protein
VIRPLQSGRNDIREVIRYAPRTLLDLLAATEAIRQDQAIAVCRAHLWKQDAPMKLGHMTLSFGTAERHLPTPAQRMAPARGQLIQAASVFQFRAQHRFAGSARRAKFPTFARQARTWRRFRRH